MRAWQPAAAEVRAPRRAGSHPERGARRRQPFEASSVVKSSGGLFFVSTNNGSTPSLLPAGGPTGLLFGGEGLPLLGKNDALHAFYTACLKLCQQKTPTGSSPWSRGKRARPQPGRGCRRCAGRRSTCSHQSPGRCPHPAGRRHRAGGLVSGRCQPPGGRLMRRGPRG